MFNHDDITPDAIDALIADLSALLAVEDAARSQRGPAARVRTSGTARSLSVQYARDCVFIFGTWGDYYFMLEDALAAFRILDADDRAAIDLVEPDDGRTLQFQRSGDHVEVWTSRAALTLSMSELRRALDRAGLGALA